MQPNITIFILLTRAICLTNLPHMMSLATSRKLRNITEYSTKVHETGPAGIESNNLDTVSRKITIKIVFSDFLI